MIDRQRVREIVGKGRHTHGWKRGAKDPGAFMLQVSWTARLKQPNALSLRKIAHMPRVEDQGEIGSCTANATTDALEFLRLKAGLSAVQLSRLDLYFKSRRAEGVPATEDSGCQIPDVMKVARRLGVCREDLWPYDPRKFTKEPPPETIADALKHKADYYYRTPSILSICASIVQGFPVVIGFDCPANMFTSEVNKSGVIPLPDGEGFDGGHCVEVTGYNKSTELFEIKNSWSEEWGDGGYGQIPFLYMKKAWMDDCTTIRLAELGDQNEKAAA